jgi:hypothetical protein
MCQTSSGTKRLDTDHMREISGSRVCDLPLLVAGMIIVN